MRALGPALRLWNVGNVEAHVRSAVDAGLDQRGARLSAAQYDRLLQFCLQKCWELSGLQADATTLRYVWEIRGFIAPAGALDPYLPIKLPEYGSSLSAELALVELRDALTLAGRSIAFAAIHKIRPRTAYDPARGIQFSTYSHRIIVDYRIDDWYRSDPEFGDTRYEGNRRHEESLEALAARFTDDDGSDSALDTPAPLGRLEVIDQLNTHAYHEMGEEVLAREAHAG